MGGGLHSKLGKNGMAFVFLQIKPLVQTNICFLAVTTRLSELKPGQAAVIRRLRTHPLSAKLTEMGCLPGEWIRIIRIAPPGDPMLIEILGYQLALRRIEADVIEVDVRPGIPLYSLNPEDLMCTQELPAFSTQEFGSPNSIDTREEPTE
jgi:ferrous iron transport protein A